MLKAKHLALPFNSAIDYVVLEVVFASKIRGPLLH